MPLPENRDSVRHLKRTMESNVAHNCKGGGWDMKEVRRGVMQSLQRVGVSHPGPLLLLWIRYRLNFVLWDLLLHTAVVELMTAIDDKASTLSTCFFRLESSFVLYPVSAAPAINSLVMLSQIRPS